MTDSSQSSNELNALVQITKILTGRLPFLEKCDAALELLAGFTSSDIVTLREFDAETSTLNLIASHFLREQDQESRIPQSITASLSFKALRPDSPVIVNDYSSPEQRNQPYARLGMKSAVTVPIHVDGEMFGALGFGARSEDTYQEETVKMVAAIAEMVGMMVAKVQLQEINAVEANIGRIISSPLFGFDVFEKFVEEAAKIIDFNRLVLNSVNLDENSFVTEFHFGEGIPNHSVGIPKNLEGTGIDLIVKTKESHRLTLDDLDGSGPRFPRSEPFIDANQKYFLGVPLVVGDNLVGTIGITRGMLAFTTKDINMAERLGNLVAGAFADFKLQEYKAQVEEQLRQNRAVLEVEAAIGRILSSPAKKTGSTEEIKSELEKVIQLDRVVISSVDLVSGNYTGDFNGLLDQPDLMLNYNTGRPYAGSMTEEVIRTGESLVIHSDDSRLAAGEMPVAKGAFDRGYQSILISPLKYEGLTVGILGVFVCSGKYTERDVEIAERLTNVLAGALANIKVTVEKNSAQEALGESEARFRQIADSIGGVFWLSDLEPRKLVYASPKFSDLWGIPIEDVYDDYERWYETIHPDDLTLHNEASEQAFSTGYFEGEYRIIKKDGSLRWIRSVSFPIADSSGKLVRLSGISEDVTDKKTELERIVEGGRLLSIGELASGVAHEINNPLAVINLYAEALMDQELPSATIEDLNVIFAQGKRAAAIVRNLLQFARKSSPETATVDAKEFIDGCLNLKNHDFHINNISATANVQMEDSEIAIDEQLMTQVVVNILSNAEHACTSAHGRGRISILVSDADDSIRISISDDGPGIPDENLTKVFDPFFTTKPVGMGTGLGLSVSHGIVAQLGGHLWVESDGRTGSTFFIDLPRAGRKEDEESSDISISNNGTAASFNPRPRLLLVEDEPDLRNVIVRVLEKNRYIVDQAENCDEVWQKLQTIDYDCILLDLRMPGTNGEELYGRIYASDPATAEKIIIVTGDMVDGKTRLFLSSLANRILEKPVSLQQLEEAVNEVIKRPI